MRWYIGIPAVCLLLVVSYKLIKEILADETEIRLSTKTLFLLGGIMLAWTIFSGLGGAFPQKEDLHWRNAILHDLVNYSWPVRYADGFDSSLTYYIAFWLLPALVGKFAVAVSSAQAGWISANITYTLYCAVMLWVVLLLLMSYLNATSFKRILLVAIVLIFFSGMDIIPIILQQLADIEMSIGKHLEWWTYIQYSSNTTQLAWVYNQAIPAWLVTALLLHEKSMHRYAFLGLMLLPYGPLPFIGLFFLMIIETLVAFCHTSKNSQPYVFIKQIITMPNIVAVIVLVPIYFLYYSTNSATSNFGFGANYLSSTYFPFVLVEFLIYALLIGKNFYTRPFFLSSVLLLFLIPLFTLGGSQDFCMRASIPLLFILMTYVMNYLLNNIAYCGKGKWQINTASLLLIACLALGAITPLTEFRASYAQIMQSEPHKTALVADKFGTLGDGSMVRDNFITMHASDSLFYRYIAKNHPPE